MDFTIRELTEFFDFLDDLRALGSVNMFGAGIELRNEFGLDRDEARDALKLWMDSYSEEPADVRAREVYDAA